jgi:hypothetical protein
MIEMTNINDIINDRANRLLFIFGVAIPAVLTILARIFLLHDFGIAQTIMVYFILALVSLYFAAGANRPK